MLTVNSVEKTKSFDIVVTDSETEEVYNYSFGKKPFENQSQADYLVGCEKEAELLAQSKIDNAPILKD